MTTIAELIQRAERDRGVEIIKRELFKDALFKFACAWIDLQRVRERLLNGSITVSLRGSEGILRPQARIEVPVD